LKDHINQYRQWIDQLLVEGKTVQVPVHGMSMFPVLMPGDKVQIKRVSFNDMTRGQVLVFESDGQWVAHRLISKDRDNHQLVTKGDGLAWNDKPIPAEKIKGAITKIIKTRSPLAWTLNTGIDKFMIWAAPVLGKMFWIMAKVVCKFVLSLKSDKMQQVIGSENTRGKKT
jgi:signal peptidase I